MPHLSRLVARNYKGFREVSLDLPAVGLVFVVGANNAGKSALTSLLDQARSLSVPLQYRYGKELDGEVVLRFDLTTDESAELQGSQGWPKWLVPAAVSFCLKVCERHQTWDLQSVHSVDGIGADTEVLRVRHDGANTSRERLGGDLGAAEDASWENLQSMGTHQAVLLTDIPLLHEWFAAWSARIYHFHVLRRLVATTGQMGGSLTLAPDGGNLLQVLLHLQHNESAAWLQLQELLHRVLPDVGELEIPVESTIGRIAFRDPHTGRLQSLDELGSGVEQLLMTFAVALTQGPPHTLVLEEPESALHPAAQRVVLSLLQQWSADRLFIVTTHSPVLIDWAPARSPVYLVTRTLGVSELADVTQRPREVLQALGVRLSDVLAAEIVVLVEGPSDRDLLATWFGDALMDPRFAIVPTAGGDAARHSRTVSDWWSEADTVGPRRVIFLRDRDELPTAEVDALVADGRVHVLGVRELENFLLDAQVLHRYFAQVTAQDRPSAELQGLLDKAVDDQRPVVLLKRVLARLRIPRLIDHELRRQLAAGEISLETTRQILRGRLVSDADLVVELDRVWTEQESKVDDLWADNRYRLAGGADVLEVLFQSQLGRHYSKRGDGPALASLLPPPPELEALILDLESDHTSPPND